MPKEEILNEINNILKEVIKKTENIVHEKDRLSLIELDIIKADIRNLYEHFNKLNSYVNSTQNVSPLKKEVTFNEEPEKPAKKKEVKEQTTVFTHKVEIKAPEIKEEDEITKEVSPLKEGETFNEKPVIKKEPSTEMKLPKSSSTDLFSLDENEIIADKFKDEGNSINDKIGHNTTERSLADKLKNVHTSDIKTLIGINEKFLMINELFDGNMSEYNDFITQINQFNSKSEASEFVDALNSKKRWKSNLDSLTKLNELIEARYS